jgi:hypothetical protein
MSNANSSASGPTATPLALTPRRRYTQSQIEQRRLSVWEMYCCGQPVAEMAASENVSPKTINRDIQWWQTRLGLSTAALKDPKTAAMDVGMTAAKLQKLAEDAYVEYAASSNPTFKVRYLEVSGKMLMGRHKVLTDAGFLPKVGHEQEEGFVAKVSFEARFGKDAPQAVFDNHQSRRSVLEAIGDALKLGIGADGLPFPDEILKEVSPDLIAELEQEIAAEAANGPVLEAEPVE